MRVYLESPFAGNRGYNHRYLRACIRDCISRGESPYASHCIGPLALNDSDPEERNLGINAGELWRAAAVKTVVYQDLGISPGMALGVARAKQLGQKVEVRKLGGEWR